MFFDGRGSLMTYGAFETGMKFDDFRWLSGGPGAEQPGPVRVIGRSLGFLAVAKQYGVALQHAEYILKPA